MRLIQLIINLLRRNLCSEYSKDLLEIKQQVKDFRIKFDAVKTELLEKEQKLKLEEEYIKQIEQDCQKIEQELAELKAEEIINQELYDAEQYWNFSKPAANVRYKGRTEPFQLRRTFNDVKVFITPNDCEILEDLRKAQLFITDKRHCNDEILKIYKHTRTKIINPYKYAYDDQKYKISEFWMFPFELRSVKSGDCEDWTHELVSYLIAAGVPAFRVRAVAGVTRSNFGHATCYVLGDDLKTWYHLNSTTPAAMIHQRKLEDMPTSKTKSDDIGLKDIWFSYNNQHAWSSFENKDSQVLFNQHLKDFIDITPTVGLYDGK